MTKKIFPFIFSNSICFFSYFHYFIIDRLPLVIIISKLSWFFQIFSFFIFSLDNQSRKSVWNDKKKYNFFSSTIDICKDVFFRSFVRCPALNFIMLSSFLPTLHLYPIYLYRLFHLFSLSLSLSLYLIIIQKPVIFHHHHHHKYMIITYGWMAKFVCLFVFHIWLVSLVDFVFE